MQVSRIILVAALLVFGFVFIACGKEKEKRDPKAQFINGYNVQNAAVSGIESPSQAVDFVYAKINAQKYLGGSIIGFVSQTVKEDSDEAIVVSVLCLDREKSGIEVSNPLVSILQKKDDKWSFIRVPKKISDQEENIPPSISSDTFQTEAQAKGNMLLQRSLPKECARSVR